MAMDEDLSLFFDTDEFADEATIAGRTVAGIYDDESVIVPAGFVGVESSGPSFLLPQSALDEQGIAVERGMEIVIDKRGTFIIASAPPAEFGLRRLRLEVEPYA